MVINDRTLALIKRFEGLRLRAYRDSGGVWTIGYGHTSRAGPPRVHAGLRISRRQAEDILRVDVERFAEQVAAALGERHLRRLNDNQFGALVSFAYNVGIDNFKHSSVYRAVVNGRLDEVPRLLMRWIKARDPKTGKLRTLRGLVRRRRAEGNLFMTPAGARRPALKELARVRAQEVAERPDLAAIWAAFLVAAGNLAAAAWHGAALPALAVAGGAAVITGIIWLVRALRRESSYVMEAAE